jgi:ferredoxin
MKKRPSDGFTDGRKEMHMKVKVDADLCTACGVCEEICPEVFEVTEEVAELKADEVPAEHEDSCRESAESCPTEAIIIEE